MSNRRKTRPRGEPNPVSELIASRDGSRIPGGCDHCDAYQVIKAHVFGSRNVHMIEVRHDDWYPVLARSSERRGTP